MGYLVRAYYSISPTKYYKDDSVECRLKSTHHRRRHQHLVEKMYPLTNNTLHQIFNDVKLQVDYECEMAFDLLRLVKKQLKEGYGRIVGIKRLLSAVEVTAAGYDFYCCCFGFIQYNLALYKKSKIYSIGINTRGHSGDGGGDDRPPSHLIGGGCRGHLKTQFGWQESSQAEHPQGNPKPRVKEDHGSSWPAGDLI
ncbi:hypothetical protein Tco_0584013 [Tanacetum coccineum]